MGVPISANTHYATNLVYIYNQHTNHKISNRNQLTWTCTSTHSNHPHIQIRKMIN